MNIILFEKEELTRPLSLDDHRAIHLLSVLRRKPGEPFDAGIINGPKGKGWIKSVTRDSLVLCFQFHDPGKDDGLFPVTLVAGLPRPQTARKILREVTSLGVSHIYFTGTRRGENSYKKSSLWSTGEVKKHLILGAEQAFCTFLPEVKVYDTLSECLDSLTPGTWIALDNYEAEISLYTHHFPHPWTTLFIGPEKGWSAQERDLLRHKGCCLAHLGKRVLRAETAAVAGITLVLAGMGLI